MAHTIEKSKETSYDDEEEEEIEPLLRYSRLGNDLKKVIELDPASCLAVHEKFLALGSHKGSVHIFDHEGNHITDKKFQSHEITVNQLSIDEKGEYISSCSDDGKTVIHGFYSTEYEQIVPFDRPVKAVAINPNFTKKSKQFVTGDDKLILSEQTHGFFSKGSKAVVLHKGEGTITCIKWHSSFIAWSNSKGVKIYDMVSSQRITFIEFKFPEDAKSRPDLYKCSMCWKNDKTLLIGWGNQVKICEIKTRISKDARDLPSKYVEIRQMFTTDYFIAGIAPFSDGNIVLLTYSESEVEISGKEVRNPRPHVRLIEPGLEYCNEKSNDALGIRGYEKYRCSLYALEWVRDEDTYFIISPDDVIVAKPRTEDDHVEWLLKHKKYEHKILNLGNGELKTVSQEAMNAVQQKQAEVKKFSYQDIGHMFLDHLCDEKRFEEAARRSVVVLGQNKEAWETHFFKFRQYGKTEVIAKYLPRDDPRLSETVYELVLYDFLHSNVSSFLYLLKNWSSEIYDSQTVVNAILDTIKTRPDLSEDEIKTLYESLAILYSNQHNYSEALSVYLKLKHDDIFPFIHRHNLFSSIDNKIESLMDFNTEKALDLFISNIEAVPPFKVMQQLEKRPKHQHRYLDRLWLKYPNACTNYHTKMVFLYAEYDRDKLLPFLKRADGYDQNAAMKLCEQRELMREKVYLLGKMGNHREALNLIINWLHDVKYAIDFCKEHNYESLWNELIEYSIDKPNFIKGLLDNIGSHVDPLMLIQRIKDGMEIPKLRDSLVKILHDYNLQMSLREDCQKILTADIFNLISQQVRLARRGFSFEDTKRCEVCHQYMIPTDLRFAQDITMFYCNHAFHTSCLPTSDMFSKMHEEITPVPQL